MLNEFKRPMWNDGYSKEQPWLNYFNSYERMHCCFGDEGGGADDGGAGDVAASTSTTGPAATSAAESAASYEDAMGAQAEGAASTGMNAEQAQQVSDAIDAAAASGASVSQQQNIAEGGNRGAAGGYTGAELGQIAAANIDTDFFNDANTLGIGAGFTSGRGSFADPNSISGVGQTDFASYIDDLGSFAGWAGQNFSIGGAISAAARALDKDEKDVTSQDISMVTGGQNYGGLREEGISSQQEKDSMGTAGPAIDTSNDAFFNSNNFTREDDRNIDTELADFQAGLAREEANAAATQQQEAQETGGIADPYEVAYQASDPFNNYAAAMEEADAAMFGGNYAGQPDEDETFGEDETDEGVEDTVLPILPTPDPEEEKEPETAMEAYFRKLGIASPVPPTGPVAPSSFQEYRSYLPPIGPADNAAYRRKLALGTPRYQEPSGPNPSISTLAAVYGLTYEEAAKRFAFPSVPKPPSKPSLPVLTTFAASGGGLNSLMRYK
jgi:hypothetical protein